MKIAAYLWDLDDTLLDTESLWVETLEIYLAAKGHPVEHEWAVATVCGRAWSAIYETTVARFPDLVSVPSAEMAAATDALFYPLRAKRDVRIPGSIALLRRLAPTAPCAIVSGSPRDVVEDSVHYMQAEGCFAFVLGSEDYPRGKPAPDGFLEAARRLGVDPAQCVVFEDSSAGFAAARAAGMRVVALRHHDGLPQDLSLADLAFDSLDAFQPEML